MKKFIINIFIFISPIIFTGCLIEMLIRNIPNDYTAKKEYLDNNASKIKVLGLGHSQMLSGFNPEEMSLNAYNAAFAAQSIKYDYKILEKYSNELTSLEYVIIPISYLSIFYQLEKGTLSHLVKNYSIHLELDTDSKSLYKNRFEIFSLSFKTNVKRLISYSLNSKSSLAFGKYGWKGSGKNADLIETGINDAKRHNKFLAIASEKEYDKENIRYLDKIFKLSKEKKIHIILVTPPTYVSYRDNIQNHYLKTSQNKIDQLLKDYENGSYLNLLNDSTFKAEDYRDANHLNQFGAKKMTKIIDSYIAKLSH